MWRYWGPIVRPVPNPTAPRRSSTRILPDDIRGLADPNQKAPSAIVDWDCVHLGPTAPLGEWDLSWYYDIPHSHAAWYVDTTDGPVRYDSAVHGAPTGRDTVADAASWCTCPPPSRTGRGRPTLSKRETLPSRQDRHRRMLALMGGLNLYYRALRGTPHRWLDLGELAQILLPAHQIRRIRFFTAKVSNTPVYRRRAQAKRAPHDDRPPACRDDGGTPTPAHDDPCELTCSVPEGYRFAHLSSDPPYGTEWSDADTLIAILPLHP